MFMYCIIQLHSCYVDTQKLFQAHHSFMMEINSRNLPGRTLSLFGVVIVIIDCPTPSSFLPATMTV